MAYGIAIFSTLISVFLGAWAYAQNKYSHNKTFSAILGATREATLSELFHADISGRLPLHRNVEQAKLKFVDWEEGRGFIIAGREDG